MELREKISKNGILKIFFIIFHKISQKILTKGNLYAKIGNVKTIFNRYENKLQKLNKNSLKSLQK